MTCKLAGGLKQVTIQMQIVIYVLLGSLLFFFAWKGKANLFSVALNYIGCGICGYGMNIDSDIIFFVGLFMVLLSSFNVWIKKRND